MPQCAHVWGTFPGLECWAISSDCKCQQNWFNKACATYLRTPVALIKM